METEIQTEVISRLKSIEGHVRGVRHMVEENRPCLSVLQQTQAIQGSLRQISLLLAAQHLNGCLREVWDEPWDDTYRQLRDDLLALFAQKA
jgi:CsoR family transcriptional regulator, copper-sensing transcriptional repressor